MIVYFSGTGNSRYCAQLLASRLPDQLVDAGQYIKKELPGDWNSEKPWVFVAPTYSWQLPHIFLQQLRHSRYRGSKKAYFVMTCGLDIGSAAKYNEELCRELGMDYMGTLQVVMPENYIALFPVPDEEQSAKIIEKAQPVLESAVELIRKEEKLPAKKSSPLDALKSGTVNNGFKKYVIKADKFFATSQCIGCGKCAKVCVLNNITMKNHRPVWGKKCTHCMACICGCPVEAIEYGSATKGKRRYLCPDYQE